MASRLGKLEGYSPASYSCTALYMQPRSLSTFPTLQAIFLIQDQLHLKFQQYLEQRGCCVLSFQIEATKLTFFVSFGPFLEKWIA